MIKIRKSFELLEITVLNSKAFFIRLNSISAKDFFDSGVSFNLKARMNGIQAKRQLIINGGIKLPLTVIIDPIIELEAIPNWT